MERGVYQSEALDRQADEIEAALQALALPARVHGGRLRGDWVSYQVMPVLGTTAEEVSRAAHCVAEAIRAPAIRIAPVGSTLRVDVPVPATSAPGLLPLLHGVGRVPGMTALAGMAREGAPLLIRLTDPATWHIAACGPRGWGKSELLRTLVVSIALTSSPREAQLLGIDLGGRELAVVEAMPHLVTELATDVRAAGELLHWVAEETRRRRTCAREAPALVLAVDDATWMDRSGMLRAKADLETIVEWGRASGVHLMAGFGANPPAWLTPRSGVVVGQATSPGRFVLHAGREAAQVRAAFLSAADLDAAVQLACAGWRAGDPLPADHERGAQAGPRG